MHFYTRESTTNFNLFLRRYQKYRRSSKYMLSDRALANNSINKGDSSYYSDGMTGQSMVGGSGKAVGGFSNMLTIENNGVDPELDEHGFSTDQQYCEMKM